MSWEEIKITMSDEVAKTLENRHILGDDIKKVIHHAESEGKKLYQPDKNLFLSKLRLGNFTVYVKYNPEGDGYVVHTAYQHRAKIQ